MSSEPNLVFFRGTTLCLGLKDVRSQCAGSGPQKVEASFQATTMMEMHVEGGMMTQHVAHKTPPRVPPKPTSRSPPSLVSKVTGGRQQSPSPVRHVKGPTPTPVRYVPRPSPGASVGPALMRCSGLIQFFFLCRPVSPSSKVSSFQIKPVRSPVMTRKQVRPGPDGLVPGTDEIQNQMRYKHEDMWRRDLTHCSV